MEVILLEDHPHLGERGHVINVADGYAMNYLIPRKLAIRNTKGGRAAFEAEDQFHKKRGKKERKAAEVLKEEIEGIEITIGSKAGKEGKLYGSITSKDVSEALSERGYEIEKKSIKLEGSIREIGTYDIEISLFQDVKANIHLLVEPVELVGETGD